MLINRLLSYNRISNVNISFSFQTYFCFCSQRFGKEYSWFNNNMDNNSIHFFFTNPHPFLHNSTISFTKHNKKYIQNLINLKWNRNCFYFYIGFEKLSILCQFLSGVYCIKAIITYFNKLIQLQRVIYFLHRVSQK